MSGFSTGPPVVYVPKLCYSCGQSCVTVVGEVVLQLWAKLWVTVGPQWPRAASSAA